MADQKVDQLDQLPANIPAIQEELVEPEAVKPEVERPPYPNVGTVSNPDF